MLLVPDETADIARASVTTVLRSDAEVDALVRSHMPMAQGIVRSLLRRIRPGLLEYDDCIQVASVAVLNCASRYDAALGIPFSGYARPRIRGAVFDLLRSELRSRGAARGVDERVGERFRNRHSEECADDFEAYLTLVIDLGVGLMLEAGRWGSNPADLHEASYTGSGPKLNEIVDRLPDRQATLVRAHYFQGVSFTEIARTWGVSRGRISQLHSAALKRLRLLIEGAN